MKEINFKPLTPEQIEVRVGEAKTKGSATLLLYIDSRAAANIMNSAVGEFNWQIEYKDVAGQIYGRLSIWDEDRKMWVYKEDTGEESNIAASKGQASDILKRCVARWGCDYLYSSPKIRIKCPDEYYWNDKLNMQFFVREIAYKEKKINHLIIVDRNGNPVFVWDSGKPVLQPSAEPQKTNRQLLKEYCLSIATTEPKEKIREFYNYYNGERADNWRGTFDASKLYAKWGVRS